jgi:glutaminyl-peptide cyclotransferase
MNSRNFFFLLASILLLFSCSDPVVPEKEKEKIVSHHPAPVFNADSCYDFVKKQVDFGPRVPLSDPHRLCGDWIVAKLRSYGLEVTEQKGTMITYDQKNTPLRNIIASYKPESQKRILLCTHWDTRPMADRDTKDETLPIDGASDGASGVGVLLEIARQLKSGKCDAGIDLVFFDLEDYGDKFCLGSEYWAQHLPRPDYFANFGVLLDMVGAKGATFPIEGQSKNYGSAFVKKIWDKGASLGYSDYFNYTEMHGITDDHVNVNMFANIPCIDIIQMNPGTGDFGPYHHRHSDNMSIIDRNTLKAVGHTLAEVIYGE